MKKLFIIIGIIAIAVILYFLGRYWVNNYYPQIPPEVKQEIQQLQEEDIRNTLPDK